MRRLQQELRILIGAAREALADEFADQAAAIAYWSLFSIFPLLLGLMALAGFTLDESQIQSRMLQIVTELLPGSADLVQSHLEAVVRYRGSLGAVGILGLLWTASKGLAAVTRAVNRAIGDTRNRSFVVAKLQLFGVTVAVAVLAVLSISITITLELVLTPTLLSHLGLDTVEVPRLSGRITSFLLVFLLVGLIYKWTPYSHRSWRQVLPGALLAAILFEVGKAGFVVYLEWMPRLQAVYGSLASILVLLLWLYLSALILIFGVEYNEVRWTIRHPNASD